MKFHVQKHQLLDGGLLNPLDGRSRQDAVGGAGINFFGAALFHNGVGAVAQRSGGINHIVDQDDGFILHVADDIHDLADIGLGPALVDNGQGSIHPFGKLPRPGHRAEIRGNYHNVVLAVFKFLDKMGHQDGHAQQVIHRDVEKALDLRRMQVHGQDTVRAGGGDQIRAELGGDGVSGLGLPVLAGIAEIGDDRGDPAGGGPFEGVDHDEKFHEVIVDGLAGGLHHKHVGASDRLKNRTGDFPVGEGDNVALSYGKPQFLSHPVRHVLVGVTSENLDILAVKIHSFDSLFLFLLPTDAS